MHEELKTFLLKRKMASLSEMSEHFRLRPEIIETHLEELVTSGCVLKKKPDPFAAVCFSGCGGSPVEIRYQWVCR